MLVLYSNFFLILTLESSFLLGQFEKKMYFFFLFISVGRGRCFFFKKKKKKTPPFLITYHKKIFTVNFVLKYLKK